ncbi:phage tail protein [Cupriavidus sp. CV2]|uniref:phage tail protein n=1 Tax=Cupriavidus ulmosensis TaxID=3065913 RepID=UPI00296B15DF|nr:phage tail protein [Cupriavidus sp. CV2]MDW3683113.1 phage tail protein [Cupriavidus sp. CV2]
MINVYEIGSTLKLTDLITPKLLQLSREFAKVDATVLQINKRLQKMGAEVVGVRNLATSAKALGVSMRVIGDEALRAERNLYSIRGAIPSGGIGLEAELARANAQAATLQARIAAMRGAGRVPGGGNPLLPPGPGGGRGGGRRPGHVHGGNMHVGPNGFGVGGVGMGMATNMLVPLAATGAAVYIGHKLYDSAKDLQTEQARFRLYGLSDEQNSSAYGYAHKMRAFGTSETQAMHFMNEAQGVFRESGETGDHALAGAKMAAPFLAKMMAASSILSSESKAKLEHESLAMLRAVELQGGAKNTDQFAKLADFGFRMTQTSGGQVNWEQLRQLNRIGGVAVQRMSPEAMAAMEPIIGEFKGGPFATAMRTAYNRMNGIVKLPNQAVHELMKAGIWDASKVELNANGGIKRFLGNPLNHADEYAANSADYYFKYVKPYYDKQGYKDTDRDRMNSMFFGSTGGNLFNKFDQQEEVMKAAGEAFRKALGIDAALEIAKGTATGAETDFQAAWTDFKTEFGKNMLPAVTDMLKGGADILRKITDARNTPEGKAQLAAGGAVWHAFTWPWRAAGNALFGDAEAKTPAQDSPYVKPGQQQPIKLQATINLDKQKVGEVVADYLAGGLGHAQSTSSGFDFSRAAPPIGHSYAK